MLKEVSSEDLRPFPKLKRFFIPGNEVEVLEGDLFINNPLLEYVAVQENKIMHVDHSTFKILKNLQWLQYENNPCYSGTTFGGHEAVMELSKNITSECNNVAFLMRKYGENY